MEDIDKNGDGLIDLNEYIGECCLLLNPNMFSEQFATPVQNKKLRDTTDPFMFQATCTTRRETTRSPSG